MKVKKLVITKVNDASYVNSFNSVFIFYFAFVCCHQEGSPKCSHSDKHFCFPECFLHKLCDADYSSHVSWCWPGWWTRIFILVSRVCSSTEKGNLDGHLLHVLVNWNHP